jgi:hypothetical protein
MPENDSCTYELLENGIHKLVIHEATHEGIDQLFVHMAYMNSITKPEETQRVIIDSRPGGVPPLNHTLRAARQFIKKNPHPKVRTVYLHNPNIMMSMVKILLDSLRSRSSKRTFMEGDKEKEAIQWLLEDQPEE